MSRDPIEAFQLQNLDLKDANNVAALFFAQAISDNGNGTSTVQTADFHQLFDLCPEEPFGGQPAGKSCIGSGVLVAADIIATAGNLVNDDSADDMVSNVRVVFGFRMLDAATPVTVINNAEIYKVQAIIDRRVIDNGPDWALILLDRPVANHPIAKIRSSGEIGSDQMVHIIGHPFGLPTKFAGEARVQDNLAEAFFVANLHKFGGNLGSPVFNSETHEVEGILARGETPLEKPEGRDCNLAAPCPDTGCAGQHCTRTTEFAQLIAVNRRLALLVCCEVEGSQTGFVRTPFEPFKGGKFEHNVPASGWLRSFIGAINRTDTVHGLLLATTKDEPDSGAPRRLEAVIDSLRVAERPTSIRKQIRPLRSEDRLKLNRFHNIRVDDFDEIIYFDLN
jgi:hypothetical protein